MNVQHVPMKRDLLAELKEGMDALATKHGGKVILPKLKTSKPEPVKVNSSPRALRMPGDV